MDDKEKPKRGALLLLGDEDEKEDKDDEGDEVSEDEIDCAQELLDAIEEKDAKAVAEAFRLCMHYGGK